MGEKNVGRHIEQRFNFEGRRYTVRTIVRADGVSIDEVAVDGGARGYVSGVVFESEESALASAHQLALNLIEGERQAKPKAPK